MARASAESGDLPSTSLNISLPLALKSFVEEQAAARGFTSSSEYIRALIREKREALARSARLEAQLANAFATSNRAEAEAAVDRFREALDLLRFGHELEEARLRRSAVVISSNEITSASVGWNERSVVAEEAPGFVVSSAERLKRLRVEPA